MLKIKLFLPILGLIIILGLSWKISQQRSLSIRFVDEDDHISGGDYINRGYKLHSQIQSNHQPLVYFASAALQKLDPPENLLMLVRRQRQMIFIYGAIWSLLLTLRFGWPGLVFILFFEFLKYGLLGNLLLMESLAVYPTVYLFGASLSLSSRRPELVFLGFCAFLIIFNLVPLYPWLLVIGLLLLIRLKTKIIWPAIGLIIPTLILFGFYSPIDWFRETIYNNWLYALPALNQVKNTADWLKIIFFPFLAYGFTNSLQAKFIAMFFSGYLTACFFNRKLFWLYPLLILANNRVLSPTAAYYEGFHLLPWLGILIWIFVYSLRYLPKKIILILSIAALVLFFNQNMPYFSKTDPAQEYYINYSTGEDYNFAVKNLSQPGDRIAVLNNLPLTTWNTNLDLATRELVYYAWQDSVPELKADYARVFYGNNPPEIILGNKETELLTAKYVNILKFDTPTELYLRRDKFESITQSQWDSLSTRGFHN